MKPVRCENGHFFDRDLYVVCPHCGAAIAQGNAGPASGREGYANWKKANQGNGQVPVSGTGSQARPAEKPVEKAVEKPVKTVADKPVAAAPAQPEPESLKDALRKASASEDGKTLSYFSLMSGAAAGAAGGSSAEQALKPEKSQGTGALGTEAQNPVAASEGCPVLGSPRSPVVGLLVGIGGPHLCEIFGVGSGMSSIGRGLGNDVVLRKDFTVSREKHALLTYEPKGRNFFIKPGESSGLTYLNGEFITETSPLKARDVIELGGSRFLFMPLCGEDFSWEEYMK